MISRRDMLLGAVRRLRETTNSTSSSEITDQTADAAYAAGEYDLAANLYQKALEVKPTSKEARIRLGLCFYQQREFVRAKDTLLLAMKTYPDEVLVRLYLGLCYARRGNVEKCMQCWTGLVNGLPVAILREINTLRARFEAGECLTEEVLTVPIEHLLKNEKI